MTPTQERPHTGWGMTSTRHAALLTTPHWLAIHQVDSELPSSGFERCDLLQVMDQTHARRMAIYVIDFAH